MSRCGLHLKLVDLQLILSNHLKLQRTPKKGLMIQIRSSDVHPPLSQSRDYILDVQQQPAFTIICHILQLHDYNLCFQQKVLHSEQWIHLMTILFALQPPRSLNKHHKEHKIGCNHAVTHFTITTT